MFGYIVLVIFDFFDEERFSAFAQFHMDVLRLTIDLYINLKKDENITWKNYQIQR